MKLVSSSLVVLTMAMVAPGHADDRHNTLTAWVKTGTDGDVAVSIEPRLRLDYPHDNAFVEMLASGNISKSPAGMDVEDATADIAVNMGYALSSGARIALETSYVFDRDRVDDYSPRFAAIDSQHVLTANLAADGQWHGLDFAMNAGASLSIVEDLQRIGFEPFPRKNQRHIDPEVSLRLTAPQQGGMSPFFESAYVARFYAEGDERTYQGLEFISGLTVDGPSLSGDFGAILAMRDYKSRKIASQWAFGPYVDANWILSPQTKFEFDALLQLVQEETGAVSSARNLSMNLGVDHVLADGLTLALGLGVELEDLSSEMPMTWTPNLRIAAELDDHLTLAAKLSAEIETLRHHDTAVSAEAALGLMVRF